MSLKDLKQKKDKKNYLKSRLQTKERAFKAFLNEDHGLANQKKELGKKKEQLSSDAVKASDALLKAIKGSKLSTSLIKG